MSAIPRFADSSRTSPEVREGPIAEAAELFNYLISGCKQRRRHTKAQGPGSLEVDYEIKFRGLHDWQAGLGFSPFKIRATYMPP